MRFLSMAAIAVLLAGMSNAMADEKPPKSIDEVIEEQGAYVACFRDSGDYAQEGIRKACTLALQSEGLTDTARAMLYARRSHTWGGKGYFHVEMAVADITDAILLAQDDELKANYLMDRSHIFSNTLRYSPTASCRDVRRVLSMFPRDKDALDYQETYCEERL